MNALVLVVLAIGQAESRDVQLFRLGGEVKELRTRADGVNLAIAKVADPKSKEVWSRQYSRIEEYIKKLELKLAAGELQEFQPEFDRVLELSDALAGWELRKPEAIPPATTAAAAPLPGLALPNGTQPLAVYHGDMAQLWALQLLQNPQAFKETVAKTAESMSAAGEAISKAAGSDGTREGLRKSLLEKAHSINPHYQKKKKKQ